MHLHHVHQVIQTHSEVGQPLPCLAPNLIFSFPVHPLITENTFHSTFLASWLSPLCIKRQVKRKTNKSLLTCIPYVHVGDAHDTQGRMNNSLRWLGSPA